MVKKAIAILALITLAGCTHAGWRTESVTTSVCIPTGIVCVAVDEKPPK